MKLILLYIPYGVALSAALGWRGVRSRGVPPSGASSAAKLAGPARRVLIVGATGGTGRELVAQALERGHEVTVLARRPEALAVRHERLQIRKGDVLDPASIEAVMSGQQGVLCALGHRRYLGPSRILSEGTRHLLRSMEAHGVPRFVCETSLGIGSSAGRMGLYYTLFVIPTVLPFYFWDKARQERLIAESRTAWTIVRPGALNNGPRRGRYRDGNVGSYFGTVGISRADVAAFMLDQLDDDRYLNAATGVCW